MGYDAITKALTSAKTGLEAAIADYDTTTATPKNKKAILTARENLSTSVKTMIDVLGTARSSLLASATLKLLRKVYTGLKTDELRDAFLAIDLMAVLRNPGVNPTEKSQLIKFASWQQTYTPKKKP